MLKGGEVGGTARDTVFMSCDRTMGFDSDLFRRGIALGSRVDLDEAFQADFTAIVYSSQVSTPPQTFAFGLSRLGLHGPIRPNPTAPAGFLTCGLSINSFLLSGLLVKCAASTEVPFRVNSGFVALFHCRITLLQVTCNGFNYRDKRRRRRRRQEVRFGFDPTRAPPQGSTTLWNS